MAGMEVLGCRLISPIGSGAAGTVFRARQLRLERDVAVKLVPEGDAGVDTAERFRREVRAIAALDHPHVVPVHDAGESGGLLVLVMKLIDGVDLRTLVAERGPVEPEAAAAIIAQVADALDAAHAAGLVHRDVKPANVLLSRGGDRRAYLADFGLARTQLAEDTVTAESHWVGTPAYASPEQRAGGIVGPPADRYSLSATLAFLITGTPPGGELDREAMAPAVRAVLEVADRGMASSPDARFASCADLAAAAAAAAGSDEATAVLPRPSPPSSPPGDRVEARDGSRSVAGGGQSGLRAALIAAIALVALGLAAAVYGLVRPDPDAGGGPPAATASPSASASATASPSTAETTEGSGAATRYPELRPGDSGPTVTAAQLLLPIGYFLGKVFIFIFIFIWLRATLPRMRYDRLMDLGWKVMLPLGIVWVFLTGFAVVIRTYARDTPDALQVLLTWGAVILGIIIVISIVGPLFADRDTTRPPDDDVDDDEGDPPAAAEPEPVAAGVE